MKTIPYNPKLKELAKDLRKHSTLSEVILWKYLKGKQRMEIDFNRQKPIGNYIIDFYNSEYRLAIEVTGSSHENKYEYDNKRQTELEKIGIRILYIHDYEIKKRLPEVIDYIDCWISKRIKL
jgi:very-short-patch-repair endonuclease